MTREEQATLNFYHFETRARGYYLFDNVIELEPPYTPFSPLEYVPKKEEHWLTKLLSSKSNQNIEVIEHPEVVANYITERAELSSLEIIFPTYMERPPIIMEELLELLSFSEDTISFEIIAQCGKIHVRLTSSLGDTERVRSHFKAFYPNAILREVDPYDIDINFDNEVAIADFGLDMETMLPLAQSTSYSIDALTSLVAIMDNIMDDEFLMFQILFKGVTAPWAKDFKNACSDGNGGSFFIDAPYMYSEALQKTESPLFAVIMRSVVQSHSRERMNYLSQQVCRSTSIVSEGKYNKLIPLSNQNYPYDDHLRNVFWRTTNRTAFILNTKELAHFAHYPSRSINSMKLGVKSKKTKQVPLSITKQQYLIGLNEHNGNELEVMLNDQMRLRHTHIVGSTGVGKSTLLANMMLADIEHSDVEHGDVSCALLDPHGDIVDDILLRIPEHRKNDVILIDPSDEKYAIGFNLFGTSSEAEKIVLGSDIVSILKRYATAWGDNMTAVLSNAVNAFTESTRNGTIIELKRFLIEDSFREEFLESVEDPSIHYYWNHEYAMVRKGIAPLLTRIDTFLRPKVIRYMLAQTGGVDFRKCIEEKKIILIKLSQGLIGAENSYLLGSLFLSKLNQVAQGRQSLTKNERHPFYIYLDEFQNFITPSISQILEGARKYGIGLVLAHQQLSQINDVQILNSVLSNPHIRICFRLGDNDAKKLESGFSHFDQSDLQSLNTGEAIMRVGSAQSDFNLKTFPLDEPSENAENIKAHIIQNTREKYAEKKEVLDELLLSLLPKHPDRKRKKQADTQEKKKETSREPIHEEKDEKPLIPYVAKEEKTKINKSQSDFEKTKKDYQNRREKREHVKRHRMLQNTIHTIAIQRGFKSVIEESTSNGGRVDVGLTKNDIRIGIEISVSNTKAYETQNIIKCIESGYSHIVLVSESKIHLKNIKENTQKHVSKQDFSKILFLKPEEVLPFLDTFTTDSKSKGERVQGYRVTTTYSNEKGLSKINKQQELTNIILSSIKSKKDKK